MNYSQKFIHFFVTKLVHPEWHQDNVKISSQPMSSSKILFSMKSINQSEVFRKFFVRKIHFTLSNLLILPNTSINGHSRKLWWHFFEIRPEKLLLNAIILILKLKNTIQEPRHTIQQLPNHLLSICLYCLVALKHSCLALLEKSMVSRIVSNVHPTDPCAHFWHVKWQMFWWFVL
jgi:hypothetical protein